MALKYYNNYLKNISRTPNQAYLENTQAYNNEVWDNSTQTSFHIMEQNGIGSDEYFDQDISVDMAIDLSTGQKKSDDWKVFSYRDLSFQTRIGLMYKYADNYWLTINTDELGGATKSVQVRRCNNVLKWIDPDNGYLHQVPCVIDYSIQSPQPQKDKEIVVGNGHITVWCQGNSETLKLRKNQRFLFNGEPYMLTSYNNMLQNGIVDDSTSILYFDMFLGTIHPEDNEKDSIADFTEYVYTIQANSSVTKQVNGFSGKLDATVMLNGEVVDRPIIWKSSSHGIVDLEGNYTLNGLPRDIVLFTANIEGNNNLTSTVSIEIVEEMADSYELIIDPLHKEARAKQPITFSANVYKNGILQEEEVTYELSGASSKDFILTRNANNFTLTVLNYSPIPLTIDFISTYVSKSISIDLKALF